MHNTGLKHTLGRGNLALGFRIDADCHPQRTRKAFEHGLNSMMLVLSPIQKTKMQIASQGLGQRFKKMRDQLTGEVSDLVPSRSIVA